MNRPYPPTVIHKGIGDRIELSLRTGEVAPDWKIKSSIGALNKACGGKEGRYKVLKYLFNQESTKNLSREALWAMTEWVKPFKHEVTKKWMAQEYLEAECKLIIKGMDFGIDHPYLENREIVQPDMTWVRNQLAGRDLSPQEKDKFVAEATSAWYTMEFGKHKYKMWCEHHNDSYDVAGNPVCTKCSPELVAHAIWWEVEEENGENNKT